MDCPPSPRTSPKILDSWKNIALHFGVTVRTVQHWERESGLPVHRQPGPRGRVFAGAAELEAWRAPARAAAPEAAAAAPGTWRRVVLPFAISTSHILLCIALLCVARHAGAVPALHRIDGPFLVVLDEKGAELWRYRLPAPSNPARSDKPDFVTPVIADLDGDSISEVLYAYLRQDSSSTAKLLCFSASGHLLWT